MNLLACLSIIGLAIALPAIQNVAIRDLDEKSHQGTMTWRESFEGNACNIGAGGASVALNPYTFDARTTGGNPNNNPLCGQSLHIWNVDTGAETTATVVGRMTKDDGNAIDVSPDVFAALGLSVDAGHEVVGWNLPEEFGY